MERQSETPRPRRWGPVRGAVRVPRRHARVLAFAAALAALGLVAGLLAAAGSGGGKPPVAARVTSASVGTFHRAMGAWLRAHGYSHFAWIVCVRNGARFEGVRVVRCNVDFGDPHIQAYCGVFRGGRLVTSAQDGAIPCPPDDAGYSQTIQSSS